MTYSIKTYTFFLFSLLGLTSCFEPEELILDLNEESPIVIQGLVTNLEGPYFVQVYKVKNAAERSKFSQTVYLDSAYVAINNATVTLTDDLGNIDVLESFNDTLNPLNPNSGPPDDFANFGFYKTTTNLKGEPGHTYTLTVVVDGKTYEATATMPALPPDFQKSANSSTIYPLISFQEPQDQRNYYAFYYSFIQNSSYAQYDSLLRVYPQNLNFMFQHNFSVFSDQFLKTRSNQSQYLQL